MEASDEQVKRRLALRPRRRRVAVGAGVIIASVFAVVASVLATEGPSSAAAPSASVLNIQCPSTAVGGTLPAVVYLPPGYRRGSARYPVIYFLHGLPATPTSYQSNEFVAQAVLAGGHRAIVVAPQGARSVGSDREYLNWGPHEDWPKAIADDLPSCIDARFRTIEGRTGRALIGLSAGGFGAFNIGLRHLRTFAAVESWSGYFAATDPTGLRELNLGSPEANRKARVPHARHLRAKVAMRPTFIGFFVGRQDTRFLNANILLEKALNEDHVPHVFDVYAGGHSGALWRRWAPLWLGLALEHLSKTSG